MIISDYATITSPPTKNSKYICTMFGTKNVCVSIDVIEFTKDYDTFGGEHKVIKEFKIKL